MVLAAIGEVDAPAMGATIDDRWGTRGHGDATPEPCSGLSGRFRQHRVEAPPVEMPPVPVRVEDEMVLEHRILSPYGKDAGRRHMTCTDELVPHAQAGERQSGRRGQRLADSGLLVMRLFEQCNRSSGARQENGRGGARRPAPEHDHITRFAIVRGPVA